jgi:hypothetical protein
MATTENNTDAGTVPNLKFPFAASRNRVLTGGWSREVTTRAYMIAGSARITLIDAEGTAALSKTKPTVVR